MVAIYIPYYCYAQEIAEFRSDFPCGSPSDTGDNGKDKSWDGTDEREEAQEAADHREDGVQKGIPCHFVVFYRDRLVAPPVRHILSTRRIRLGRGRVWAVEDARRSGLVSTFWVLLICGLWLVNDL